MGDYMKIAFIGTGVMGKPMALHLSKAGHDVSVYNRTFEKAKSLEPFANAYKKIEECVRDAEIIFSIVGYPSDVEEVYAKIIPIAKKGTILVDMTTSSPKLAIKLYHEAKANGLYMIDAPVTGGDLGAINGTLSIMVGGDEDIFERIYPLLNLMGSKLTYMGKAGSGMHAKLTNQIVIAGNIIGIAEALVYAKSKGLNPSRMIEVITGGSANSWQAANNGPKMVNQDYQPGFYLKHFLKDLRLILAEKEELQLTVLEEVASIYEKLSKIGYDNLGTQSVIEYYLQKMM
jgi:3-hydroxyisobutyrate dehydrogenase